MLSAFKAQAIHELKPRDKSKIESLLAYGDRLLVGLNTGALRIYRVNEQSNLDDASGDFEAPASPTKRPRDVELLREEEKFSRRPIQQLAIIKEVNLLVSLSDTYISLHDLQSYELVERLEKTKGAACFTVVSKVVEDAETSYNSLVSRLAVAVKRRIICWTWKDMELLPDASEIGLEASVKSLNWVTGTRLVAGMDPGFSILDVETEEITNINRPAAAELAGVRFGAVSSSGMGYMGMGSWVPKPMATPISTDQILLAKDVNTLITDINGEALDKRQVPWSFAPEAVGYSYPYMLALQPSEKGILQVRNPDTLSLLQTIAVPNAAILHVPQPNISLAHAGKGFLVASERTIWRMNALSYDSQLQDLVERHRFDEAVSLLALLEDTLIENKLDRIREIKIQKAIAIFAERQYTQALDIFTEAQAPPERVIQLYPTLIAGDLSRIQDDGENGVDDAATEITEAKQEDVAKDAPSTPSKSLFGRVTGTHSRNVSDSASISIKSPFKNEGDGTSAQKHPSPRSASDKPLEGEDLLSAVRALLTFLPQARVQIQKYMTFDGILKENPPVFDRETGRPAFANLLPDSVFSATEFKTIDWQAELLATARLVDTTLFRSYMLARPSLAGSLFRLENFCDPEVVQSALYETRRYSDLVDFLHGKKFHRQALEMLVQFGKGEADGDIPAGMQGPYRTAAYLKQLPPELVDIVLEFVRWPIDQAPEVGMEVFLADTENAERLPRDRVIDFLATIDNDLEIRYLEHIVDELGDSTPAFHQRLVDLYLNSLKDQTAKEAHNQVKPKLESFLDRSKQYNAVRTFRQLPADESLFYEARAIVLSAMGNHKQALSIYVYQIKDYAKAEEYCNKVYVAEQAAQQASLIDGTVTYEKQYDAKEPVDKVHIFATLLGMYLRPPAGEEKRWPQALDLLSRHGARLPASSTLGLMPDDLAVAELDEYFRGRIRHSTSLLRQEMIVKSLEAVRRTAAERHLLLGRDEDVETGRPAGRNRRVRIMEEDHCRVCHKRFGASAVRVYPSGEVVHYGCVGKRPEDAPVGMGRRGWG